MRRLRIRTLMIAVAVAAVGMAVYSSWDATETWVIREKLVIRFALISGLTLVFLVPLVILAGAFLGVSSGKAARRPRFHFRTLMTAVAFAGIVCVLWAKHFPGSPISDLVDQGMVIAVPTWRMTSPSSMLPVT